MRRTGCGPAGRCRSTVAVRRLFLFHCLFNLFAVLGAQPAAAQERPSPIAPYRYASPPAGALDSLEQQKAQSYRTQLEGQRRLQEMNRAPEAGATRLRSQGELNREIGRMDRLLQQQ
ncbi:MAG TPA: hypothetical protein VD840_02685 [Sinorhizobium sp.]|nr:hypothetical protein [Sinorhizobium sp.]